LAELQSRDCRTRPLFRQLKNPPKMHSPLAGTPPPAARWRIKAKRCPQRAMKERAAAPIYAGSSFEGLPQMTFDPQTAATLSFVLAGMIAFTLATVYDN
jgi:hypothetical protein